MAYDLIIIGSGPTAISSMQALLNRGLKILVVTGASGAGRSCSNFIHPKIRVAAIESNSKIGLSNCRSFADYKKGALARTAAIGGLANFWGQQFIPYLPNDPWPRHIFCDYKKYIAACKNVEAQFIFSNDFDRSTGDSSKSDYSLYRPRLLTGTKESPNSNHSAMLKAFWVLSAQLKADVSTASAHRIKNINGKALLILDSGEIIEANKIIMAAGVVGTLDILSNSFSEIFSFRFKDHSPYMFYFWGLSRWLKNAGESNLHHFNNLTVEKFKNESVELFSSCYRMSRSTIGLILASLGLPPFFVNSPPPNFVDFITPVQVWSKSTFKTYYLSKNSLPVVSNDSPRQLIDVELKNYVSFLTSQGSYLHRSETPPGYGFHYHAGEVEVKGGGFVGVEHFLRNEFNEKIVCVDASILQTLGVRPHTQTAMASSYFLTQTFYDR